QRAELFILAHGREPLHSRSERQLEIEQHDVGLECLQRDEALDRIVRALHRVARADLLLIDRGDDRIVVDDQYLERGSHGAPDREGPLPVTAATRAAAAAVLFISARGALP